MSKSTDPDHFFQTTQSIAETNRKSSKSRNDSGSPIRFQSKILAITNDAFSTDAVYIAESAGTARRISLETRTTTHLYRGASAPLTSLALQPGREPTTLYAGCWDKTIWSWDIHTQTPQRRFHGHTDFVKSVLCLHIDGTTVLISGSADAKIILWNATSGEKLHTLNGHSRAILALAIDPFSYPAPPTLLDGTQTPQTEDEPNSVTLFSAASSPELLRWQIPLLQPRSSNDKPPDISPSPPFLHHETSINALSFSPSGDELWTASSDGTAKCLSRVQNWNVDTTLPHGDYVRDVLVDEISGRVVTVGRDENVKVWDLGTGKLEWVYEGHWEEVTGCVVVEMGGGRGRVVATVGIDGTVRMWGISGEAVEEARRKAEEEEEGEGGGGGEERVLTEEEERELAELMGE